MRPIWSRIRHQAISAAVVVTCASSIQLSGCLNRSANDVKPDLAQNARKAARDAARESAERRQQENRVAQSSEKPAISDKAKASSTASAPEKKALAAKQETSKSSSPNALQRLFSKKETSQPVDPFIDATDDAFKQQAVASRTAEKPADRYDQITSITPESKGGSQTGEYSSSNSPSDVDDFQPNATWESIVSAAENLDSSRPFPNWADEMLQKDTPSEAKVVANSSDSLITPESAQVAKSAERAAGPKSRVVGPTPPENFDTPLLTRSVDPSSPPVTSFPAEDPFDSFVPVENSVPMQQPPAQVVHSKGEFPTGNPLNKEIETLLTQSKQAENQGNLDEAYRLALAAEHLAVENQISFGPTDTDPHQVVRGIAGKMWLSNRDVASSDYQINGVAQTANQLPTQKALFDQVFGDPQPVAQWESSNQDGSLRTARQISPVANSVAIPSSTMPTIRPAMEDDSWTAMPKELTVQHRAESEKIPHSLSVEPSPMSSLAPSLDSHSWKQNHSATIQETSESPDLGVKFAIAQSLDGHKLPNNGFPELPDLELPMHPSQRQTIASAVIPRQQPLMIVQPEQNLFQIEQQAQQTASYAELSQEQLASDSTIEPETSHANRNFIWGLIGVFSAVISAIAGLIVSRKNSPGPKAPEQADGSTTAGSQKKFRIKRAA